MRQSKEQLACYEAKTNSAFLLPKGEIGRTADLLIGCMVPVLMYPTSAIVGHFGQLSYVKAQEHLESLLAEKGSEGKPIAALMYHLEAEYDDAYTDSVRLMKDTVAKAAGLVPEQIPLRAYDIGSEIVVDWRAYDAQPIIYARSLVKLRAPLR